MKMNSKKGGLGTIGIIMIIALILIAVFVGQYIGENKDNIDAIRYCVGYCDSLDECNYHKGYEENQTYVCKYFVNGTLLTHEYQSIKK